MRGYGDLLEDDDQTPDVGTGLAELAWQAGYGAALLKIEYANSNDAVGDRIIEAADKMRSRDLWDEWDE